MKYSVIFKENVATIFQLQWNIENIPDIFLQYSVLCRFSFLMMEVSSAPSSMLRQFVTLTERNINKKKLLLITFNWRDDTFRQVFFSKPIHNYLLLLMRDVFFLKDNLPINRINTWLSSLYLPFELFSPTQTSFLFHYVIHLLNPLSQFHLHRVTRHLASLLSRHITWLILFFFIILLFPLLDFYLSLTTSHMLHGENFWGKFCIIIYQ